MLRHPCNFTDFGHVSRGQWEYGLCHLSTMKIPQLVADLQKEFRGGHGFRWFFCPRVLGSVQVNAVPRTAPPGSFTRVYPPGAGGRDEAKKTPGPPRWFGRENEAGARTAS